MKNSKYSRLTALLLCLLLTFSSLIGASADTAVPAGDLTLNQLNLWTQDAVDQYCARIMACTDYESAYAICSELTEEEYAAFTAAIGDEQLAQLNAHLDKLYAEYQAANGPAVIPPVNFTRVAPFLAPATGADPYGIMLLAEGDDETTTPARKDATGLETSKTVSGPVDGVYTLTLEAYVTGASVTETVTEDIPTDIILVLDQSGSMDDVFTSSSTTYNPVYSDDLDKNKTYYVYTGNGYNPYMAVTWCDTCEVWSPSGWEGGCYDWNGHHSGSVVFTAKASADDASGTQLYDRKTTSAVTKLAALKNAVTSFADAVEEKAKGADGQLGTKDDVDHRVAIVGFASQSGYSNNTEILTVTGSNSGQVGVAYNSLGDAQYSSALQSMKTTDGVAMVEKAIAALDGNGATEADLGMIMAGKIFEKYPLGQNEKRNRVVVLFTDGEPNRSNNFDSNVANSAIKEAYDLKNVDGATVYSVGVFSGANATVPMPNNVSNVNKYMHYVSSNFKTAQSLNNGGTATYPAGGKSYYLSAGDAGKLNSIFEQIANEVQSGGASTTLTSSTIVKDVIADSFVLPANADTSSIKLYTADCTGKVDGKETFSTERVPFTTGTVAIDGNAIGVKGFDYSANWCGTETVNSTEKPHGKKLIIEIPVVVREGFLGGNNVLTNGPGSGVYPDASTAEPIEEFVSPKVNVEVAAVVNVDAQDKHVYLYHDLTAEQMIAGVKVTCDPVVGEPFELNMDPNVENFGLADWQHAYVTINQPKGTELTDITVDGSYTVTCTITPDDTSGSASAKSDSDTANIYVYKPVLTFKDSEEKYADVIKDIEADEAGTYYGSYYMAKNHVSEDWVHGDTTAQPEKMTGDKPGLTLAYQADTTWLDGQKVIGTKDVNVNVTKVSIGETDITSYTTGVRSACGCTHETSACPTVALSQMNMGNNPDFVVHIYDVYTDLTIMKSGHESIDPNQTFIFKVSDGDLVNPIYVSVDGNGSVTIKNLTVGQKYTVIEQSGWSWRYTPDTPTEITLKADATQNVVTVQNTRDEIYWLDGNAESVTNVYGTAQKK